jgi:hypothetical protein
MAGSMRARKRLLMLVNAGLLEVSVRQKLMIRDRGRDRLQRVRSAMAVVEQAM